MAQLVFGPFGVLFFIGVVLLTIAVPLWRMWLVYAGSSTRRPFDASGGGLQPPAELVPTISALMRLGFRRVGEAQLDLPGTRAVALTATGNPHITGERVDRHTIFVMVDADGTIVAETGQVPGVPILLSLNSSFADATVVETMYPRGESIDDPDFHSGHNTQSIDAAYQEQRAEISRWRMRHGTPQTIASMTDYLRVDASYRERYARRKLRGPLLRKQVVPAALVSIAAIVLGVLALTRWPV